MTEVDFEVERISLDELYDKAGAVCFVCNKYVARSTASREHIIPQSLGGTDDPENLTISHKKCNNKRGNGFKPIYSQYHRTDQKHFAILEEHGLLIQVVPHDDGAYIILSRKKDEHG